MSVITVYAADAEEVLHGHTVLAVTRAFHDTLPLVVRDHLDCEVEGPSVPGRIDHAH